MSAYLVSPAIIGILAAAIAERTTDHGDAENVARILVNENLRSVGYRYEMTNARAARAFLGMSVTQYRQACVASALDSSITGGHSALDLREQADRYTYQACECDDWPTTQAARAIDALRASLTAQEIAETATEEPAAESFAIYVLFDA